MKKKNNNKKKISPGYKVATGSKTALVKPEKPTSRRSNEKDKIKGMAPIEGKIGNKLINDKKYRGNLFSGLMKGITFGLYKP